MVARRRLDTELVRRGLVADEDEAGSLVQAGRVLVGGAIAGGTGRLVSAAEALVVSVAPPRFVGRGGDKLDGAVEEFRLEVEGLGVLDAGASTGGFTDCLLQHGAARVVALDVGHSQLHERLRRDERVMVLERTNLRHFDPHGTGPFDAAVADLSFISLTAVMGVLVDSVRPGGWLVLLVKPQFEAERAEASRGGGVISDPTVWTAALQRVVESARVHGAAMMGVMVSPLRGAEGNVEFLVHLAARNPDHGSRPSVPGDADAEAVVAAVSDAAAGRQERR